MSFKSYIRDKFVYLFTSVMTVFVISLLLVLFNLNKFLIVVILLFMIFSYIVPFLYEFYKKKYFYDTFKKTLESLDKKYLITEMITNSNCLDGRLLLEYLYEIDKSMHEEVNNYKYISNELKEYIELWCHEIKTPVATSKLIIENNNNKITKSILEELEHIENYIEQVLFYSRSDTVEKDYIITDVKLKNVVESVIKRNKKDLISKKIKVELDDLCLVKSDAKWLEFIINQIILNSIKYSKGKNPAIKISSKKNKNNEILFIEDNGIGIEEADIAKVFDKGFTGANGRKKYNATGIGLYLCKKLCNKLGHEINISSRLNEYTTVSIIFPSSSMLSDIN